MAVEYKNKVLFDSGLRVTQKFGVNEDYYKKWGLKGHEGLDVTPLNSLKNIKKERRFKSLPYEGKVVKDIDMASKGGNYGNTFTIWYPHINEAWQYCHNSENEVFIGQALGPSTYIGYMGGTGNTNGDHVHINRFKVDDNGYRLNRDNGYLGGIDPLPLLLELQKGVPMTDKDPLQECLAQHEKLVTEAGEKDAEISSLKKDLEEKESELATAKKQAAAQKGIVTTRDNKIAELTEDLASCSLKVKELENKPPKKVEAIKDPMRYAVSLAIGALVTWAYTQYPFLGELHGDQQAVVTFLVSLVVKGIDKYQHETGSVLKLPF